MDKMVTRERVVNALHPSGAIMKYGDLVSRIAMDLGVAENTIYGEVGQILQALKLDKKVELIKGKGAGWRRVLR